MAMDVSRYRMWPKVWKSLFSIVTMLSFVQISNALRCVQCNTLEKSHRIGANRNGNKIDMTDCYEGRLEPRPCVNPNHTHCITYYFTEVHSRKPMVLWRKCGVLIDNVHTCQMHDIGPDAIINLYGGAPGAYKRVRLQPINKSIDRVTEHRRRSLVQVCAVGCGEDGCLADKAPCKHSTANLSMVMLLASMVYSTLYV